MNKSQSLLSEHVRSRILIIRRRRVLLDADLAQLYGAETRALIQAVKRNLDRFPRDFMFSLTNHEIAALRSQIVISKQVGRGGRRSAPHAFTEQGVAMLSSVLNSTRAIAVNIEVMRAFVRLREAVAESKELAQKLDELDARMAKRFEEHDQVIVEILAAIRALTAPRETKRRPIGFVRDE